LPAFERHAAEGGPRVVFLSVGGSDTAIDDLARVPNASVVRVTPDGSDVTEIERKLVSAYRDALARDEQLNWDDQGWMLAWPAILLTLLWFRRGWTMRWCIVLAAGLAGAPDRSAHAEGITDWVLTADQQGRLAFDNKEYERAADLFDDPLWKGKSLYRTGKYTEAAEVYARMQSAEAAFAQGVAHVKGREYRRGIEAFEKAIERQPDYPAAAYNLKLTHAILDYVEREREQSDSGEESGIGADDVVFDNESSRGAETTIDAASSMKMDTAEQWMRTVDTRTADFLRTRFALEATKDRP
jgi:Ca-activated chloride channel family protein